MTTLICAAAVLAAATASPMVAAAGPVRQGPGSTRYPFADITTIALGAPALCGGSLRTWVETDPDWAGRAIFDIQADPMRGFGLVSSPFAPVCAVPVTMAWRNLDTGAKGTYQVRVVAGLYGSIQYAAFQETGPGRIAVDVHTDYPSTSASGAFDVPGPPPASPR